MIYKIADISDIDATLKLHKKYQIDTIKEEDKKDGFVTTSFSKEELKELIAQKGLFVAKEGNDVKAYVMSASWEFWSKWPMFAYMADNLLDFKYKNELVTAKNSYQYGPICIDKSVRGSDVLENIFKLAATNMAKRYDFLVTFVNQINPRSYRAHTKKLGLDIVCEFDYNNNKYWELCLDIREL